MKIPIKTSAAGALLAVLGSLSAYAQTPVLTGTGNGTPNPRTFNGTVGFSFTLNSSTFSAPQTLEDLGIYEDGQANGTTQEVGLFSYGGSSAGIELATATITFNGSTGFVYAAATPVSGSGFTGTLALDTTYVLGTLGTDFVNGSVSSGTYVPPTTSNGVTLVQGQYSPQDGVLEDPFISTDADTAFVGPNLTFSSATTPEPATYALLGLGALVLLIARRSGAFKA